MNEDIVLMMKIYDTYTVDWMGDEIKKSSDLTRHHIVKRENGGENGISNYALLTTASHHLIHYLEENYYEYYILLNNLFLELNKTCAPPTIEYYERVKIIMKRVRKCIKNSKRIRRIKRRWK